MIIADGVPIKACIKTDIAFQLPDFFLQGVDLFVDGFQFFGIGKGILTIENTPNKQADISPIPRGHSLSYR